MRKILAITMIVIIVLSLSTIEVFSESDPSFKFIDSWGSYGGDPGQFMKPLGLAYDFNEHTLYVADSDNYRVQKFTSSGEYLGVAQFDNDDPTESCYDYYFGNPTAVAVDKEGFVYAADSCDFVEIRTPDGELVDSWSSLGRRANEVGRPIDIEIFEGKAYVLVYDSKEIYKMSLEGEVLAQWGALGAEDGEFWNPRSIALDSEGYVYVSDWSRNDIQKFTNDGSFIMSFGSRGSGPVEFEAIEGIDIDAHGHIFAADLGNARVQMLTNTGEFLTEWKPGEELVEPYDVVLGEDNVLYIADKDSIKKVKIIETGLKLKNLIEFFEESEECFLPIKEGKNLNQFKDELFELDLMIRRGDIVDREVICKIVKIYDCMDRQPFPYDMVVGDFAVMEELRMLLLDLKRDFCN